MTDGWLIEVRQVLKDKRKLVQLYHAVFDNEATAIEAVRRYIHGGPEVEIVANLRVPAATLARYGLSQNQVRGA